MKEQNLTFLHGKYTFSLDTSTIESESHKNTITNALRLQFSGFLPAKDSTPAIIFRFCETLEPFFPYEKYLNIKSVKFADNRIYFKLGDAEFVYYKNGGQHIVYTKISTKFPLRSYCRALNKSFYNRFESQISISYYRIFLLFSQLVNIEYNTTYIHGATVSDSAGNAILFPADSGVGKSSMLFKMSLENEYNYIADDLSIISTDGECYYSGRAISTKPYHLSNFDHLKELLDRHMPFLQKVQWKLLNDNRLVYGLRPKTLFKGKISKQASIKTVVHLINTNEKEFSLQTSDADTLASASANILMNELILCYSIVYKALSISGNTMMESPGNIYKKTHNWYKDIFSTMDLYILKVPYMSHPEKMYDFLVKNGILK